MNLLVLSHAANRSGAPVSLLAFLKWLATQPGYHVWLQSLRSGPLEAQFHAVANDAHLATLKRASLLEAARRRVGTQAGAPLLMTQRINANTSRAQIARFMRESAIDVVLFNSVASGAALDVLGPILKREKIPSAVWVHELEGARRQFDGEWQRLRTRADHFFVVSSQMADELNRQENVSPQKISIVPEMIDFAALSTDKEAARQALRTTLGVEVDTFIVGGCGTMEARKGFDLWPQIAALTPKSRLVWLGGDPKQGLSMTQKMREQSITLDFLPSTDKPREFFAALDVFCLPSREDPFPLVALEAMAQGVPIVCFEGSGGIPELVGDRSGISVKMADVEGMARALDSLRRDAYFRAHLGANAAQMVRTVADVQLNGPKLLKGLKALQTA